MFSLVFIMFWLRLHLLFTQKWWKQFGKWMFSKTASETCVCIYNNTIQYSMQETRTEKEAIWNWEQVSLIHIVSLGEGFDPLSSSGRWALQSWKVWLGGGRMSVYLWGTWWLSTGARSSTCITARTGLGCRAAAASQLWGRQSFCIP